MSMTNLDNLARLVAPAHTPLPWHFDAEGNYILDANNDAAVWLDDAMDGVHEYILHAANALPVLLADHARMVAEVARLRGLVEDACHHLNALGQTGKSWAKSIHAELAGE